MHDADTLGVKDVDGDGDAVTVRLRDAVNDGVLEVVTDGEVVELKDPVMEAVGDTLGVEDVDGDGDGVGNVPTIKERSANNWEESWKDPMSYMNAKYAVEGSQATLAAAGTLLKLLMLNSRSG